MFRRFLPDNFFFNNGAVKESVENYTGWSVSNIRMTNGRLTASNIKIRSSML